MSARKRYWKNRDGSKTINWEFDFKDEFGKRRIRSGFKTKLEAEKEEARIKNEINECRYVDVDKNITFAKAANDFLNLHAKIYCKRLNKCLEFLNVNEISKKINPQNIETVRIYAENEVDKRLNNFFYANNIYDLMA